MKEAEFTEFLSKLTEKISMTKHRSEESAYIFDALHELHTPITKSAPAVAEGAITYCQSCRQSFPCHTSRIVSMIQAR